jgi:acyl-CoA thioesterase
MPGNGEFTLDNPALVVHVGLAYTSDFETLDISSAKSDIRDKEKNINSVSIIVDKSSGFLTGPDADHLVPYKQKRPANYGEPDALLSELVDINIPCGWSKKGRIMVRQTQPLPCSILAVIPQVTLGGN